jgi:hypothetical protein
MYQRNHGWYTCHRGEMRRRAIERARTEQAQPMAKPAYAYGRTTSAKHFDASDTLGAVLGARSNSGRLIVKLMVSTT